MLFHSMLMVSNSWWVVEKCLPVNLCLMWHQIFSIGFKSGPGLNICLIDLFSSLVLVVFAVWAGVLSCWKQAFLQYSPVFQSINLLFTVYQLTSTSSWKGSPHHDTSSSMLNCGRDAFTIVFLTRSLNTPLWRSACNWNINSSLHTTLLNHSESNLPYSGKNLILSNVWESNGFSTHLRDIKPALDNLLVIVLLERVLFSEVEFRWKFLSPSFPVFENEISAGGHPCTMRLWAFQILSFSQHYLLF